MTTPILKLGFLIPTLTLAAAGRLVDIRVTDERGQPVRSAHVLVHSAKENDASSSGLHGFQEATDSEGRWSHEFKPKWGLTNLQVFLHEDQPEREVYPIWLEYFVSYKREKATYELTLPRVINPISLKAKAEGMSYRWKIDDHGRSTNHRVIKGTPAGFDLDLMQWLPPHGEGRKADFQISVSSLQKGWRISERELAWHREVKEFSEEEIAVNYGIWEKQAVVTFPNPGDGIIRSAHFWPYCKLKMPHRAPESGYGREYVLTESEGPSEATPDYMKLLHPHYAGYYLRVRTKLDEAGKVVSANYAKFMLPRIGVDGFSATFFFNPTENDTNLEYSGSNLLWPRPLGESIFTRPPTPPLFDIREH